jgi:hypothetical protein
MRTFFLGKEGMHACQVVIDSALAALATLGFAASRQEWTPPDEGLALRSRPHQGERALYPHDLREGEHGFHIESCAGAQVLARLSPGSQDVQHVLDLGALKGRRIMLGDYTSPQTTLQAALF